MHGALEVNDQLKIKSISAVKPSRGSGQTRAKKRRGGENVLWKRVTANFDDAVKVFAANPAIGVPLTRLVFFKHLTVSQGMAGRRYADVVRKFERFHMAAPARHARSANLQPSSKGEDQELERQANNGTMREYLDDARYAKRQYKKLMKVLDRFADPITGRNYAKDQLDNLCLLDQEPAAADRAAIGAILSMIADAFAVKEKR
jgi:hypothetical protein